MLRETRGEKALFITNKDLKSGDSSSITLLNFALEYVMTKINKNNLRVSGR